MCCRSGDRSGDELPALHSGHSSFTPIENHEGLTVDTVALSFLLCVCVRACVRACVRVCVCVYKHSGFILMFF